MVISVCISYSMNSNAHTTPVRKHCEPCTRINSAQSIIFGISSVINQYYTLPSSITCKGIVLWFSGRYLSNVSQPIRINYLTWKYNINRYFLPFVWLHPLTCSGFLYGSFHINITGRWRFFFGRGSERYRKGSKVIEIWNTNHAKHECINQFPI